MYAQLINWLWFFMLMIGNGCCYILLLQLGISQILGLYCTPHSIFIYIAAGECHRFSQLVICTQAQVNKLKFVPVGSSRR